MPESQCPSHWTQLSRCSIVSSQSPWASGPLGPGGGLSALPLASNPFSSIKCSLPKCRPNLVSPVLTLSNLSPSYRRTTCHPADCRPWSGLPASSASSPHAASCALGSRYTYLHSSPLATKLVPAAESGLLLFPLSGKSFPALYIKYCHL